MYRLVHVHVVRGPLQDEELEDSRPQQKCEVSFRFRSLPPLCFLILTSACADFHRLGLVSLPRRDIVGFAKQMIQGARLINRPVLGSPAAIRVGVHTGSCISGIIGTKNLKFSLLGEDVVTAALMEHTGKPDCIHASEDIALLLPQESWQEFKVLQTKEGQMQTFLLEEV